MHDSEPNAVVGFDRSEFILLERAESYELRVEVQTGTLPQDISLGVVTVPGSASEGERGGGREGEGEGGRGGGRERGRER